MALYASVFLIVIVTALLMICAALYVVSRRAVPAPDIAPSTSTSTRTRVGNPTDVWSWQVQTSGDPARSVPSEETPAWALHVAAARVGDRGIYKTRRSMPFTGEHWNPYAESQSTAARVKAARRKPRPYRSPPAVGPSDSPASVGDPYVLLGVSRVASTEEIERAYRRRVSTIHPDKFHRDPIGSQHAHEMLKQLNAAMQLVRDRRTRARYDGGHAP